MNSLEFYFFFQNLRVKGEKEEFFDTRLNFKRKSLLFISYLQAKQILSSSRIKI
jgi:hypothetical protein